MIWLFFLGLCSWKSECFKVLCYIFHVAVWLFISCLVSWVLTIPWKSECFKVLCYIHVLVSNVYGVLPAVLLWVLSLPLPVSYSTCLIVVDGEFSFFTWDDCCFARQWSLFMQAWENTESQGTLKHIPWRLKSFELSGVTTMNVLVSGFGDGEIEDWTSVTWLFLLISTPLDKLLKRFVAKKKYEYKWWIYESKDQISRICSTYNNAHFEEGVGLVFDR